MIKPQTLKKVTQKMAVPTILLTGFLLVSGHLFMIVAGAGMTLEHRLSYGRWWDRGRYICHGKAGVLLLLIGCTIALAGVLAGIL